MSYKLDILGLSLAAILVIMLSTGVVEALINVQGGIIKDPILKPINFTVANVSADPITVTGVTIFADKDPVTSGIQPFTFNLNQQLGSGEDFFFAPELKDVNGNPIALGGTPKVSITTEKTNGNGGDPGKQLFSFIAPPTGEELNPPEITASLEPICGEDDEGLFTVDFSATDDTAVESVDATLNGNTVVDGQTVELELDDEAEIEFEDGILEIEDSSFSLVVIATDESGNTATEIIIPSFSDLEECDDDDEDEEEDDEDEEDDDDDEDEEEEDD